MLDRELIVEALHSRVASVPGVVSTARNPVNPPNVEDIPRINIFEFPDKVVESSRRGRGQAVTNRRELRILLEVFTVASTESAASKVLWVFVDSMRTVLFEGGNSLGFSGAVDVREGSYSAVLRPRSLEKVAVVGMELVIKYIEQG